MTVGRRTTVDVPGFAHANPVPVASRIGPFLATGVLTGRDPDTREMPDGLDAQCANVFRHVCAVLAAAGGGPGDILKLTVHLVDPGDREALNREWTALFPDPADRPARQVVAATLGGGALVHVDLLAVLEEPRGGGRVG
ncbi:RidA family protein [Isoptericola sp. NPDC019482]|uniref:RidA family protein n=1 Tax=Isoptericola sp. NPDC019482 TaxID=3154688 RepID=UPI0034953072